MASDNHASYTKIGITIVMGVIAIVLTLVYLGGMRGRGDEVMVETYYDRGVSGLVVGSAVNFRGVKIGEVREVSFVGNKYVVQGADNSRIYILMAVKGEYFDSDHDGVLTQKEFKDFLVDHLGLRATVSASGITGMAHIECDYNLDRPPVENIPWTPKHYYIPPKPSLLDSFGESATKVMNQINKMDMMAVWSNMTVIVESISAMSESTRTLLESRQSEIDRILLDVGEATSAAKTLMEKIRDNPSLLIRNSVAEPLPETQF